MSLSKQTKVNLEIGSLIALGGGLVWLVMLYMEFRGVVDRVDNAQNRLYVIEHPADPWSIRYKETHRERYAE